jgi:hypothetical protein
MFRPFQLAVGASIVGAAAFFATSSRADTITLSGNCSYESGAGCSANCTPQSINCTVQAVDTCAKSCTETPSTTCTTACADACKTTPASFSCTSYCSDQCDTECTSNGDCGASSHTDCVTACQGQCSFTCNETPATTDCTTTCKTSCTATENTVCSVKCQVKDSSSCNITPASCTASCSGTGGVVVCNGQVVYVASSAIDAGEWYVDHLDAQFDTSTLNVTSTTTCTGNECDTKTTASCAASPGTSESSGGGLLLAGLAFVGVAATRKRKSA